MVQNPESPGLFGRVDSTVIVTFAMTLKMDGKFSQNSELISIRRGKIFAQPHTFIMHLFFIYFFISIENNLDEQHHR